ncbi:PadR family transcriptional regulator [Gluconacetobacter tumulisoli]|uniref:PadR family transcriptional regulator n=1 Tax=Gluconacetobacter tumulisoli TaxID=1286189 RepID=A0A7W4PK14_9PROT|nr:PadR family transcriptional regulator [Gluconacetobacter tumulisoli]MBB2200515.1 PadR family transcriptional regulator [Gluconacetobacter tumulisoli]
MFKNHTPSHRLHHVLHAIGRRGGRHGFGRGFGDGFGRGFGGGDFPTGRKLGSEDLQLVLLALLAEKPAHGYEMIRLLEERSGGFYAPSPGMIYPALTYLDEIGYAAVTQDGNRKLYTLTDDGRAYLDGRRAQADAILDMLARIGGRMAEVREAFAGVDAHDPQAADELHQARHVLKRALVRKRGCSPDEARRIAQILARAAADISGDAG